MVVAFLRASTDVWFFLLKVTFRIHGFLVVYMARDGLPHGSVVKSAYNAGDGASIPALGRSPGGEHGNPLQHSCLENPMDRGAWRVQSMRSQRVGHERRGRACTHVAQDMDFSENLEVPF